MSEVWVARKADGQIYDKFDHLDQAINACQIFYRTEEEERRNKRISRAKEILASDAVPSGEYNRRLAKTERELATQILEASYSPVEVRMPTRIDDERYLFSGSGYLPAIMLTREILP